MSDQHPDNYDDDLDRERVERMERHTGERAQHRASNGHGGERPLIPLVAFDDIKLGTERSYLVKGLIPRTGLAVVWGPPKCGKSFWTFDLVMHVALGWTYRGRKAQQGGVVYCAFEGAEGFKARAEAFRRAHTDACNVPFYLVAARMNMAADHRHLIASITEQLADQKPVAVVLDTLNRSMSGSESDDEDMGNYVKAADAIREAFGCVVIIVHHCGIEGTRPRGHTSLTGAVDAQLAVKRDGGGNIIVKVEHMKDGAEGAEIISALKPMDVGTDEDGDTMTSCIIVPSDDTVSTAVTVKGVPKLALDALYEAIAECGEVVTSAHIPPRTRTIPVVRWQQYFEAKTVGDRTKPDSKRRAFVRATEKLQELKIIGIWQENAWVSGQAGQART
jgi:AAA domain